MTDDVTMTDTAATVLRALAKLDTVEEVEAILSLVNTSVRNVLRARLDSLDVEGVSWEGAKRVRTALLGPTGAQVGTSL